MHICAICNVFLNIPDRIFSPCWNCLFFRFAKIMSLFVFQIMSCQTGIEASQELREFLGGCRGGCTRCVKVLFKTRIFDWADFGDGCRDWCWSFDGAIVLLKMMLKLHLCRSRLLRMGTGPSWSWTLTRELSAAGRRTGNCQI